MLDPFEMHSSSSFNNSFEEAFFFINPGCTLVESYDFKFMEEGILSLIKFF